MASSITNLTTLNYFGVPLEREEPRVGLENDLEVM